MTRDAYNFDASYSHPESKVVTPTYCTNTFCSTLRLSEKVSGVACFSWPHMQTQYLGQRNLRLHLAQQAPQLGNKNECPQILSNAPAHSKIDMEELTYWNYGTMQFPLWPQLVIHGAKATYHCKQFNMCYNDMTSYCSVADPGESPHKLQQRQNKLILRIIYGLSLQVLAT